MEAKTKRKKKQKQKQQQCHTNSAPDLNNRKSNNSNASTSSASVSVEAPRGCLRFFISHSSSSSSKPKSLSKTPKTAPISRPRPATQTLISGKRALLKRDAKQQSRLKTDRICSPLNVTNKREEMHSVSSPANAAKLVVGSNDELRNDGKSIGNSSVTKTPPVQSSLSPEIQCGSNTKAATPACYAAGHVVSGVTDKRKCRPRGILTIEDNNDLPKDFDGFHCVDNVENSGVPMLASPVDASMCWLLSPCRQDPGDEKENYGGFLAPKAHCSPSSPSSALGFSLDLCNVGSNSSSANNTSSRRNRRRSNYLLSPREISEFQECSDPSFRNVVFSHSPKATPCGKAGSVSRGHSPLSTDTLASENVMQTPEACSSLEGCAGLLNFAADDGRRHRFDSELHYATQVIQRPNLSPQSCLPVCEPPSLSFQFDHLTTSSNSVDLSHFQKALDDPSLYSSNSVSSVENMPNSQLRISWREGLLSRIFEMDEFDSCRCLSDEEEEEFNICCNEPMKSCQSPDINVDVGSETVLTSALKSAEFLDGASVTEGKGKEMLSALPYSCAESISTDGSSLFRSDESDWSVCYHNNLFEV